MDSMSMVNLIISVERFACLNVVLTIIKQPLRQISKKIQYHFT